MRKSKIPETVKIWDDKLGNLIECHNNGKRILLYLRLAKENCNGKKRKRELGFINIATKSFHVRRKSELHLFRKMNAYGFNHKLLDETCYFDKIRLTDESREWLIPVKFILENGKFMNFVAHGGFELQIFISLDDIEQFKRIRKF